MLCSKCEKQNLIDATFCQHCGNKLEKSETNKKVKDWRDWLDIIIGYPLIIIVVLCWMLMVIAIIWP